MFCTAHPLLRIILRHPRRRRFFPAKRTNKGRFCRAKALIRNNNVRGFRDSESRTYWLTASRYAIEKQENEKNVRDPKVCSGFSLRRRRVIELNVLAEALDGGCEACGTALSNCINETVSGPGSLLYICYSNSECEETNICRTKETPAS